MIFTQYDREALSFTANAGEKVIYQAFYVNINFDTEEYYMDKFERITLFVGLAVVFSLVKLVSTPLALDNVYTRLSLSNLPGVGVLVESVSAEMKREGLTQSQIASDVESELQEAGIRVLTRESGRWVPGTPYLYVNINAFKSKEYVYSIQIEFHQDVFLKRNPEIKVDASTWSKRYVSAAPNFKMIRGNIKDMVAIFINAFLSVNSRSFTESTN
jgi:hypothetical protein